MTTPRSDTDAIIRPKHEAPADETQAIPRQAPAAPGRPTGPAARPPAAVAPAAPPTQSAGAPKPSADVAPAAKPDLQKSPGAAPARPSAGPALAHPSAGPALARPSAGPAPAPPAASIPTRPPAPARRTPSRGPRRARLQLRHIDPWSALKFSLVVSIALFFVWMVAVGVLYGVLNGLDVFKQVNKLWADLQGSSGEDIVTPTLVFGGAAVIGAINILLFTALSTVGAFIYNLCADLVGGLEITLGERD